MLQQVSPFRNYVSVSITQEQTSGLACHRISLLDFECSAVSSHIPVPHIRYLARKKGFCPATGSCISCVWVCELLKFRWVRFNSHRNRHTRILFIRLLKFSEAFYFFIFIFSLVVFSFFRLPPASSHQFLILREYRRIKSCVTVVWNFHLLYILERVCLH